MEQLIVLQQTVISLLQRGQFSDNDTFPQLSELVRYSDNARSKSVNALAQQFQRMSQAAPLIEMRRPATPPPENFRDCRFRAAPDGDFYSRAIVISHHAPDDIGYILSCHSCSWTSGTLPGYTTLKFNYGYESMVEVRACLFYFYSHWPNLPRKYGCLICGGNRTFDWIDLKLHLKNTPRHSWGRVKDAYMPLCGNILS